MVVQRKAGAGLEFEEVRALAIFQPDDATTDARETGFDELAG